jgi:hypothetical protein
MEDIDSVLKERGDRYGSFADNAKTTQLIYNMFVHNDMPHEIKEAIHMICHKLARVRHGDCMYADNFVDIAGYATLASKWIDEQNGIKNP